MNMQTRPFDGLRRLLVATDYSKASEGAIREALKISKLCSSRLIAMSVIQTGLEFELTYPQVIEKEDEKANNHLDSIRAEAKQGGVFCQSIIAHSQEPYEEIFNTAIEYNADMIVIGRHDRTRLLRFLMGSITAKISAAPCNVLVVPPDSDVKYRSILTFVDGSKYTLSAIREAIGIAKRCESSLVVVSASGENSSINKSIGAIAQQEGITPDIVTIMGEPYEAVLETAKQRHADLIIVASQDGFTEKIVWHSKTAVLVVRTK